MRRRTIFSGRLLIFAWVIIWFTSVPLFHTHLPDISDRLTSQGGVAHTIFSPDLPGEFFRFSTATHQDPFAHLSNRVSNSPELGFVFSAGEVRQPGVPSILWSLLDRPFLSTSVIEHHSLHRRHLVLVVSQGPRAPPSVISL